MSDTKSIEELQEDLQQEQDEKDAIITELDSLFSDAGFRKLDKMNNICYQQTKGDYKAQFSIEDTSFNYSCYITTTGDNAINYTAKGTMDGILKSAYKFIAELNDVLEESEPVKTHLTDDDTSDLDVDLGEDVKHL